MLKASDFMRQNTETRVEGHAFKSCLAPEVLPEPKVVHPGEHFVVRPAARAALCRLGAKAPALVDALGELLSQLLRFLVVLVHPEADGADRSPNDERLLDNRLPAVLCELLLQFSFAHVDDLREVGEEALGEKDRAHANLLGLCGPLGQLRLEERHRLRRRVLERPGAGAEAALALVREA